MEEVNIPSDLEIACGYCDKYLGTINQLMSTNVLKHECLEKYENVSLDIENKKVWGLNAGKKRNTVENPIPGCSKDSNSECDTQISSFGSKDFWTYEATKFLICTYIENKNKFESPQYNKKAVWEIISEKMKKINVNKSGEKCSEKWRNLKKTYEKTLKEKNSTGNSGNIFWTFFDDFHEIYFKDPHYNPVFTINSSGSYKKRNLSESSEVEDEENLKKNNHNKKLKGTDSSEVEENLKKNISNKKLKGTDIKVLPDLSAKKSQYTATEIENRRQQRHNEKMKLKKEMFDWFKKNFNKED